MFREVSDLKAIKDITNYIFIDENPEQADIIFIPGGSFAEVAEKAAELWMEKYAPIILPSGKYSYKSDHFSGPLSKAEKYNDVYSTEWEFFRDVLITNGVDESSILKEEHAESTYDNAFNSLEVTNGLNLQIKKAIVCCKSFHARRCYMFYQWAYPAADIIICPSDVLGISKHSWFNSEIGIDRVMGELMKCGSQFSNYIKSMVQKSE